MCTSHNPYHCFIPPYVLHEIAQNGTQEQQEHARMNLASSWQIRVTRAATTGAQTVLEADDLAVSSVMERLVYDAENSSLLPGRLVKGEGDPATGDEAVDEAYDGAGATYDLYKEVYGRNSIDDRGMPIISTVHYRVGYDNAFWNGRQMVYGDGDDDLAPDQRLFRRFTRALDVIGHELTHGVIQFDTSLLYNGQSGALNESLADVFGILVRQYVNQETAAESDWLVGKEIITENVRGKAIRSMKEPGTAYDDPILGKDPQPGHMDDYVNTTEDAGGVHINSGILNRAFYVASLEIGGYAWEKAGRIWYVTMRDKLFANAVFDDVARLTYETAAELYGKGSLEQKAVRFGWQEVGLSVGPLDDGDDDDGGNGDRDKPDNGGNGSGCFESFMGSSLFNFLFGRS